MSEISESGSDDCFRLWFSFFKTCLGLFGWKPDILYRVVDGEVNTLLAWWFLIIWLGDGLCWKCCSGYYCWGLLLLWAPEPSNSAGYFVLLLEACLCANRVSLCANRVSLGQGAFSNILINTQLAWILGVWPPPVEEFLQPPIPLPCSECPPMLLVHGREASSPTDFFFPFFSFFT